MQYKLYQGTYGLATNLFTYASTIFFKSSGSIAPSLFQKTKKSWGRIINRGVLLLNIQRHIVIEFSRFCSSALCCRMSTVTITRKCVMTSTGAGQSLLYSPFYAHISLIFNKFLLS
jgi:hypothetical protein